MKLLFGILLVFCVGWSQDFNKFELMLFSGHYDIASDENYGYQFQAIYGYHPSLHTYVQAQEDLVNKNLSAGIVLPLGEFGNLGTGLNLHNDQASQWQVKYFRAYDYFVNYLVWSFGEGQAQLELNYDLFLNSYLTGGILLNQHHSLLKVGLNYYQLRCEFGWLNDLHSGDQNSVLLRLSLSVKLK